MFKNLDFKRFAVVFAVLVMCVSMMVPVAFAATNDVDVILTQDGIDSSTLMKTMNYDYHLVLSNNKPLTIRYLKENPNYYIDFSWDYGKSYDFHLEFVHYKNNGQYTVKMIGKGDGDTVTSYRINAASFSDIAEDNEYYDIPLIFKFGVSTNYSSDTSKYVTVSAPKPPAGLNDVLGGTIGFAESLFNIASQTVDWVLANPLALIVCVLGLFGLGVMVLKVLSKGV